ncbi:MAG TPA: hypothetical protein VFG20_17700, partial [Planctomycetaceae bacterium]|nr:hypothetical protein [Planctomycetaceae bacterium]
YQKWSDSGNGRKFRAGRAMLEGQLGLNLWEASKRVFGDRGIVAVYPPTEPGGKPEGVLLMRLADGDIGPHLKSKLEALVPLAGDKLKADTLDGGWLLTAPDGNRTWLKDRWVMGGTARLFDDVRRRLSESSTDSLAKTLGTKLIGSPEKTDTSVRLVIDAARIRELIGQSRFIPAKLDNPLASLLIGGLTEYAALGNDVLASLQIRPNGYELQFDLAADPGQIDAAHKTLLTTQPLNRDELLPTVPRRLVTMTLVRDWQAWYRQRDALLEAKVLPEFDKFETGLATFLPGKDFSQDILSLMSGPLTLVFAEQTYPHLPQPPGLQLPAGALVVSLTDVKRGSDIFNLFNQTLISITNLEAAKQMRQPWLLSTETYNGATITYARYLEIPTNQALPAIFNAQPASAVVGSQYIAASSVELCKDLIDALQSSQQTATRTAATSQRNFELIVAPDTVAQLVKANHALIEARSVQDGKSADQAKTEREILEGLLRVQKPLKLSTDVTPAGLTVKLQGGWQ